MSDPIMEIIRAQQSLDRRLGQTEVKEIPLSNIGARVYNNAAISINNNTQTALTFNSERFDTDGLHSTSVNTSRLTCTRAGKHLATAHVEFAANVTGLRFAGIRLNGTTYIALDQKPVDSAGAWIASLSTVYEMALIDYIELVVFQNSGGALNVNASGNYSPELAMWRLV